MPFYFKKEFSDKTDYFLIMSTLLENLYRYDKYNIKNVKSQVICIFVFIFIFKKQAFFSF